VSCGATSKARNMKESRRDFIKASLAISVITVSRATTQPAQAAAAGPKKIALVVSTKKKDNHEAAFAQALSNFHWHPVHNDKHADGDYDKIKPDAKDVDGQVDLIVAAGGLPAAIAVATALKEDSSSTPFVFLVGRYPQSASGDDLAAAGLFNSSNKAGGVDQNVPAQNENNFKLLRDNHGVAIDKVGLIVNDKNPITTPEVTAWKNITDSGKQPDARFIYHLASNDASGLKKLFDDIRNTKPPPPDGIIVSSDAYLRSLGNVDFDKQLRDPATGGGKFPGWVCYPYKEYVLASGANSVYSPYTPDLATAAATDQNTAYWQLGLKAVDALNGNPAKLATWDSSTRSWVDGDFPT
jgi:hypothetical protein